MFPSWENNIFRYCYAKKDYCYVEIPIDLIQVAQIPPKKKVPLKAHRGRGDKEEKQAGSLCQREGR